MPRCMPNLFCRNAYHTLNSVYILIDNALGVMESPQAVIWFEPTTFHANDPHLDQCTYQKCLIGIYSKSPLSIVIFALQEQIPWVHLWYLLRQFPPDCALTLKYTCLIVWARSQFMNWALGLALGTGRWVLITASPYRFILFEWSKLFV